MQEEVDEVQVQHQSPVNGQAKFWQLVAVTGVDGLHLLGIPGSQDRENDDPDDGEDEAGWRALQEHVDQAGHDQAPDGG